MTHFVEEGGEESEGLHEEGVVEEEDDCDVDGVEA